MHGEYFATLRSRKCYHWTTPVGSPGLPFRAGTLQGFPPIRTRVLHEESRRTAARERGAARPHRPSELGHPAYQCEPRSENRPAGDRRECPCADRCPLRHHHHPQRRSAGPGLFQLRLHARQAPRIRRVARRSAAVRVLPGPAGAAATAGRARLHPFARLLFRPGRTDGLPGNADAAPGRARRQLLPRRQGRRPGVHQRGRGGAAAARLAGGERDSQRPYASGRAARPR